jgi:methyltransferase (TIGR00027 family)
MSAVSILPPRPRLDFDRERKHARALLSAARAGDPAALQRFRAADPKFDPSFLALHVAQRVIAREHGFASWAKLKHETDKLARLSSSGTTALIMAASRALEAAVATPLYRDPLAHELAGADGHAIFAAMRPMMHLVSAGPMPEPYLSIRTRWFDDALERVTREHRVRQIVLLGAGMDARAFRATWPRGSTLFEVDRREIFERKEPVLRTADARARCRRRIVRADLGGPWTEALDRAGFDPGAPAAFLLEGVLQYFEPADVEQVLAAASAVAAPGSWIGLDTLSAQTLESAIMVSYFAKHSELGRPPIKFGVDDPAALLARHRWWSTTVVAGTEQASYGRWPYRSDERWTQRVPRAFFVEGWRS